MISFVSTLRVICLSAIESDVPSRTTCISVSTADTCAGNRDTCAAHTQQISSHPRRDIKRTRRISKRCQNQPRRGGKRDRKYLVRRRSNFGSRCAAKGPCLLSFSTHFLVMTIVFLHSSIRIEMLPPLFLHLKFI